MESVIALVMRRSGVPRSEAVRMIGEARREMLEVMFGSVGYGPEVVLMRKLGLGPEYLDDVI